MFTELINQVAKQIAWDIQLHTLPVSGKLEEDLHPLSPSRKLHQKEKSNESLESFINMMNKIGVKR